MDAFRVLDRSMPRTAEEFADYFKKSASGRANRIAMDAYYSTYVGKPRGPLLLWRALKRNTQRVLVKRGQ
jgi:hypothetical protein